MLILIIGQEIFHIFFYLKNEIPPIKPIRQFHSAKIINSISDEKGSDSGMNTDRFFEQELFKLFTKLYCLSGLSLISSDFPSR